VRSGCAVASLLLLAGAAGAQVRLDGSFGPAGTLPPDALGNVEIPQDVGRREGANLMHSFSEFSIPEQQSATFSARDPGIQRVLARVTGMTPSQIDGALRSRISGADVYLFNPAGVFFGAGATLDVGGSLYVSSADALRLADGNVLHAQPGPPAVLSSAPPDAWEFAGPSAAAIRIEGSRLAVLPRASLSFVAGPIAIAGRPDGQAVLHAPGGLIDLVAIAAAGRVGLDSDGADTSAIEALADVSVSANAQLTTVGERSGSVRVRARDLEIDRSFVFSDSKGDEDPLPLSIDIEVSGDVVITGPAELGAELDGSAATGDLLIVARGLRMTGPGAVINSWLSQGSGQGGDLRIDVSELQMSDGAQIRIEANGPGQAGRLVIEADRIDLSGAATFVGAESRARDGQIGGSFAEGVAVKVLAAEGEVSLRDGAQILSVTRGAGDGGDIEVEAGKLQISGVAADTDQPSGIFSNEEPPADEAPRSWQVGARGSVAVHAGAIEISDGGVIQAFSAVREPGEGGSEVGSVSVGADRIVISGSQFRGERRLPSGITTRARFRDAGNLSVSADHLQVLDGAAISATTTGPGRGGSMVLRAERVEIGGRDGAQRAAGIFAESLVDPDPQPDAARDGGPAGDIALIVRELTLSEGGLLRASTETAGAGGQLAINPPAHPQADPQWTANANVLVSDGEIRSQASPENPGIQTRGGDIAIHARALALDSGTRISASNDAQGPAGSIEIHLADDLRSSDSEITTEARNGRGGNVRIEAGELVYLLDSTISASVTTAGIDAGGNITIDPRLVVLNRSTLRANAAAGNGGNIDITAGEFLRSADSILSVSSRLGIDGTIVIRSPIEDLLEDAVPVQAEPLSDDDLVRRGCAAQRSRSGSLTVAPRVVRIGPQGVLEEGESSGERCEER
jgi:filamentous hemagglutinin family protein